MDDCEKVLEVHPAGEVRAEDAVAVDNHGRRIHVERDPASPATAEHRPQLPDSG